MMSSHESPGGLRLFIALPIPAQVQAAASRLQTEVRRLVPRDGVRWTRADQFHLTLKFLGNVESRHVPALTLATCEACQGLRRFALRAAQVGCFPDERRPRVLWLGLQSETAALRDLQGRIEQATARFAEEQEIRGFNPHLTLARLKQIRPAEARALAEGIGRLPQRVWGEWVADQVEILRSELHPEGSRYTCLAKIPLAG